MRKDIEIPVVKDVYVVAVKEWNDDFTSHDWNTYLINNSENNLEVVIVVSRGYDDNRKTAILRHGFGTVPSKTFQKIEMITDEVLSFTNEFMLTYFIGDRLFEKTFRFASYSINDKNAERIPLMKIEGIKAK